jgi:hypothetical protein
VGSDGSTRRRPRFDPADYSSTECSRKQRNIRFVKGYQLEIAFAFGRIMPAF